MKNPDTDSDLEWSLGANFDSDSERFFSYWWYWFGDWCSLDIHADYNLENSINFSWYLMLILIMIRKEIFYADDDSEIS